MICTKSANFTVTDAKWAGLFGYMNGTNNTGILNVIVTGAKISGTYAGGIISYAIGGSIVKGCVVEADSTVSGTTRVGGVASTISAGSNLSYCVNNAEVIAQIVTANSFYGGVIGVFGGGGKQVKYCVNKRKNVCCH